MNAANGFNNLQCKKITKLMLNRRFTLFVALNAKKIVLTGYIVKITELSLNCCFGFNKLRKKWFRKQFTLHSA